MRRLLLFAVFTLVSIFYNHQLKAQADLHEAEYKIHSIFIYNFTKYVQWPEEYSKGDFIIGILGKTNLDTELQKMATARTISGRKITIKKYADVANVDKRCHILFISSEGSNLLSNVLNKTSGAATLIITQKDGLGKFGSLINFVSMNGKYRFEINMSAFEKSKLKFEQQLKAVAILI